MLNPLYLDTARLGQMSPLACRASVDFSRFASEQGCSLYLSQFLSQGAAAWPESFRHRYPALEDWQGVDCLASRLKSIAGASPASDVVLAARSAELMRFAAKLLIGPCRNVLLTDLSWPAYEQIFERERRGSACRQTRVELRRSLLEDRISPDDVIKQLVRAFVENQCDGLFLPLVDNLGVQLPVRRIVERVRREGELRFVVVDGAQSIGHVPLHLADGYCDLLLAGCHKWLRAFSPLGLAFFGHAGSQSYIRASLSRWLEAGDLDDPLLAFVQELQSGKALPYGETVQVAPLLTANGAAIDALERGLPQYADDSRTEIVAAAESNGWRSVAPHPGHKSRILLFERKDCRSAAFAHEQIREAFLSEGIAISSYDSGLLRLSLPDQSVRSEELEQLAAAFRRTAGAQSSPRYVRVNPIGFDDSCR